MTIRPVDGARPLTLMAVHAHPDDESSSTGGTLARYAAAGVRTVLITCTDGSQGDAPGGAKPGSSAHTPQDVARQRSAELDRAAAALGISDVIRLDYPDSGMPESSAEANSAINGHKVFSQLPIEPLVEQMVSLLDHYQPASILTYPPNGMTGHPDHIRVHDVVATAHRILLTRSAAEHHTAPRLYYTALSRSQLNEFALAAQTAHSEQIWLPPYEIAVPDATITTAINVQDFWVHKLCALAAHASQSDAAALHRLLETPPQRNKQRTEEFVRAYPPRNTGASGDLEYDLIKRSGHRDDQHT